MSSTIFSRAGLVATRSKNAIPIYFYTPDSKPDLSASEQRYLKCVQFEPKGGNAVILADGNGNPLKALIGTESGDDVIAITKSIAELPELTYYFAVEPHNAFWCYLFHGLHSYSFNEFKQSDTLPKRKLVCGSKALREQLANALSAHFKVRDLVNLPAESLGPADIVQVVKDLGKAHGGKVTAIEGDALLKKNFPLVHAVGRASNRAPQLVELRWGKKADPLLSIVGKGVCYDTGGLNLKPGQYMRNMKKDMGGAAHAIGLAEWIMSENLPVQIQLLIPTVDNAVAGNAFRPGDVFTARNGSTVEIDNTDAEGRLILADALTYASELKPKMILDFATLTGAARVALGTEVPVYLTNHPALQYRFLEIAPSVHETTWPLPLHQGYRKLLDSKIADIANCATVPFGGAITAALFLQSFMPENQPWVHFDIMAYNTSSTPGKPEGGEAMGLRTVFKALSDIITENTWPQ